MQEVRAIGDDAIHVCVDMQDLFALDTAWHTPSIPEILPNIERLVRHRPERTVFTRFTTPKSAGQATGHWQAYYRRWRSVTTAVMDPSMLDLVTELRPFAPPARIVDKPTYSAFGSRAFRDLLRGEGRATLICSGVETDVCVLATVMSAMDLGYRVIVVADACHSSVAASHEAAMELVYRRFEDQIEIGSTDEVIARWA